MAEAEAIGALEFLQNLGKDALIQLLQRAGDVVVVVVTMGNIGGPEVETHFWGSGCRFSLSR